MTDNPEHSHWHRMSRRSVLQAAGLAAGTLLLPEYAGRLPPLRIFNRPLVGASIS